jgi:hypothetical protein
MKMYSVVVTLVALALVPGAEADRDARRKAADSYEIAVTNVIDALRNYEKCLVASRGRDPCLEEFSDLDMAQDRFETAVSEYGERCR